MLTLTLRNLDRKYYSGTADFQRDIIRIQNIAETTQVKQVVWDLFSLTGNTKADIGTVKQTFQAEILHTKSRLLEQR